MSGKKYKHFRKIVKNETRKSIDANCESYMRAIKHLSFYSRLKLAWRAFWKVMNA